MEDLRLIELAAKGNDNAFEELVRRYEGRVFTMSLRMVKNPEDAADITQEAFIRVWRSLARFKGEARFSTWLYRIVSNLCADYGRRQSRHASVDILHDADEMPEVPDLTYSPEQVLVQQERTDALKRAVDALSSEHREIFVMREVYGLSYLEISETLGLEEGTVKSRLFRAREALRKDLGNITELASSKHVKGGDGK